MARKFHWILVWLAALAACTTEQDAETDMTLSYPETAVVEQVDDYHGTAVADPYRWLEDDVRENEDVKRWVDAQNEVTFAYLANIEERAASGLALASNSPRASSASSWCKAAAPRPI